MGTWGSGNLESDMALDYRDEMSANLCREVWTHLQDPTSIEADEDLYNQLFVELEWMLALNRAELFNGWSLPAVAELNPVLEDWIKRWAVYFDDLAGEDFKAERQLVIERTFNELRSVCAHYEAIRAG